MRREDGTQTILGGLLHLIFLFILLGGIFLYWAISNIGSIPPMFWLFIVIGVIVAFFSGKSKTKKDNREARLAMARALREKKNAK